MKKVIHIYGASGSGTSTLGKRICDELGYTWMDTDDYFWVPTNPKYTMKRPIQERLNMMQRDIEKAENVVISGSKEAKTSANHNALVSGYFIIQFP